MEAVINGTRVKAASVRRQLVARAMMNDATKMVRLCMKRLTLSDIPLATFTISLKPDGNTISCHRCTSFIAPGVIYVRYTNKLPYTLCI